jgi:surfeit locus 1 family protein
MSGIKRIAPHIAAAIAIMACVLAGVWQHGRMLQKDALRTALDSARAQTPMPLPHAIDDWTLLRFRPVVLAGHFDTAQQIMIDNRQQQGQVGYHVVTPFVLDDGRTVLVNRGFIAAFADRRMLPPAPAPEGPRTLLGRLNLPGRYLELTHAPPQGALWQNLDPARFTAVTGINALPVVVELDATDPAGEGLARDWPTPDFGREQNMSYMVQWYLFAALAIGLWIFFTFFRHR